MIVCVCGYKISIMRRYSCSIKHNTGAMYSKSPAYSYLFNVMHNTQWLYIKGVLSHTHFGVHGFSYTHLRKIINIKKAVPFTTWKAVIHDFWAHWSENYSIYDAEISYTWFVGTLKRNILFTKRFQDRNLAYNWEASQLYARLRSLTAPCKPRIT